MSVRAPNSDLMCNYVKIIIFGVLNYSGIHSHHKCLSSWNRFSNIEVGLPKKVICDGSEYQNRSKHTKSHWNVEKKIKSMKPKDFRAIFKQKKISCAFGAQIKIYKKI